MGKTFMTKTCPDCKAEVLSTSQPNRQPMRADIAQIIHAGWQSGKSSAEVAAEILWELDAPALTATPAVGGHSHRSELDDASNACLELCSKHGFATGHGDTVADMIREIDGQIATKIRTLSASPPEQPAADPVTGRDLLEKAVMILRRRAAGYDGRATAIFSGRILAEELRGNAREIEGLADAQFPTAPDRDQP